MVSAAFNLPALLLSRISALTFLPVWEFCFFFLLALEELAAAGAEVGAGDSGGGVPLSRGDEGVVSAILLVD